MGSMLALDTPLPSSEWPRIRHTRLRLRMLEGRWKDDLRGAIVERVGELRARAWGIPATIASPLRDLAEAVSVLYREVPTVAGDGELAGRVEAAGLWRLRARSQRLAEALNACAVRVDVDGGRLTYRIVTPDLLMGRSRPGRPGVPEMLREARLRVIDGRAEWCIDELDIVGADPSAPSPHYRVIHGRSGEDITERVLGARYEGESYPYRYADGRPFLPYQLDHASGAPLDLWEADARTESVDGTLLAGVLAALIDHAALQAAWPQRYAVGVVPLGVEERTDSRGGTAATVVADPTAIMLFGADGEAQPLIGQWQTAADVGALQDLYERRLSMLAQTWGLSPSDLVRTGGDPRSGVALALSRQGIRDVQQQRAPVYRGGDERLLALSAALLNRATGSTYAEGGYAVTYQLLPLSAQEQAQLVAETLELLDRDLLSREEARARILGEDIATAAQRLPAPTTTRGT